MNRKNKIFFGKRNLFLLFLLVSAAMIATTGLSGCAPAEEPAPAPPPVVEENPHPEDALAMIVNLPTTEERREYDIVETLELQETEESLIFVAVKEDTTLRVVEIEMQEDGNLKDLDTVFTAENAPMGFAVEMIALRPEGAPFYKLLIKVGEGEEITYYISYNGKDGNPKIEYIMEGERD